MCVFNEGESFVLGLMIGVVITGLMLGALFYPPFQLAQQAIKQIEICEQELPRSQRCEITARVSIE